MRIVQYCLKYVGQSIDWLFNNNNVLQSWLTIGKLAVGIVLNILVNQILQFFHK